MGAFADALVNSGMRQAQALVIERSMGGVPPIPGTLEFKEALIRVGVDHHSATLLSNGLLSAAVSGDGKHWKYRDEFKRADTVAPAIGGGWVAKGAYVSSYPLPAATDGKITGMGIECPGGLTTYWMRALPATPVTIKARTAWLDLNNGQAGYQTFALICTNSAANLVDNMGLHLTLTHTTLSIQERILATGGGFTNLVPPIDIQPRLSLADGENEITVVLDPANNRGTVRLNEREYTFESQNLAANIGNTIAVELMQNGGPSTRWRGRILEVAADW